MKNDLGVKTNQRKPLGLGFLFLFTLSAVVTSGCAQNKIEALERGLVPTFYPMATIRFNNFCIPSSTPPREVGIVFGLNRSVRISQGSNQLLSDFDRDFIPDFRETSTFFSRGFNFRLNDSNEDNFSDGAEFLSGLNSSAINPTCTQAFDVDSDGDLLSDCDETHIAVRDEHNPDEDGDLIPDGFEFYFGLDPDDGDDGVLDYDNDGITNLEEIRLGTYIRETNLPGSHALEHLAYGYETRALPRANISDPQCYEFDFKTRFMRQVTNGNLVDFRVVVIEPLNNQIVSIEQDVACIRPDFEDGGMIQKNWGEQVLCSGT